MMGPPGAGKTMLARRLPGILPPFTADEALETSAIHSVAGLLPSGVGLLSERPFRAPHHTASAAALAGGGVPIRPGEVALAHHGCLFLDELLEFQRSAIEALRQPLEDAVVTICRARERAVYPARVMLVAAVNPCPCGYAGSPRCGCSSDRVQSYRSRLSGPLLDRIDIHLALPAARVRDLHGAESGESSAAVRARVVEARERANQRAALLGIAPRPNAALSPRELRRVAVLGPAAERLLSDASERLGLSARAHGKVLRLARTIADLAAAPEIAPAHVAEAVQLRVLDRALPPVSAAVSAQQSVPEA